MTEQPNGNGVNEEEKNKDDDAEKKKEKLDSSPRRYIYNKEELKAISKIPYCKKRPKCLEICYINSKGLWDPVPWSNAKIFSNHPPSNNVGTKNSSMGGNNGPLKRLENDKDGMFKRKMDQRERIKEESQDDIVLSPQRRSFGTGCHIVSNKAETVTRQPRGENHTHHLERTRDEHLLHRGRVNAGRIQEPRGRNDWSKPSRDLRDEELEDGRRTNQRNYSRNYDYDKRTSMNSRSRYHNSESRHDSRGYEDEPEWFTGGPTSQHDTIELRGFDEDNRSQEQPRRHSVQSNKTEPKRQVSRDKNSEISIGEENLSEERSEHEHARNLKGSQEFDINEIFKLDSWRVESEPTSTIPVMNEASLAGESGTSRFAQWFSESRKETESPIDRLLHNATFSSVFNAANSSAHNSRQSTFRGEDSGVNDKQLDVAPNSHSMIAHGQPQSHSFAASNFENAGREKDLVSLLQKANINVNQLMQEQQSMPTIKYEQARSVEEIEANLVRSSQPGGSRSYESAHPKENLNELLFMLEERMRNSRIARGPDSSCNQPIANNTHQNMANIIPKTHNNVFLADYQAKACKDLLKEQDFLMNRRMGSADKGPFFANSAPPPPHGAGLIPHDKSANPNQWLYGMLANNARAPVPQMAHNVMQSVPQLANNVLPAAPQVVNSGRQPVPQNVRDMLIWNSLMNQQNHIRFPPQEMPKGPRYEERNFAGKLENDSRISPTTTRIPSGNVSAFTPTSVIRKFSWHNFAKNVHINNGNVNLK